jgi:hypothetical protein
MADFVLLDGDTVMFLPTFDPGATVVVLPGRLKGSGPATLGGKKLCVVGDEGSVEVKGVQYFTGQYSIPGTGTLSIEALADDQKAKKSNTGGTALMLKGGNFTATFKPDPPPACAKQPPPGPGSPVPDSTPQYSGKGMFVTTNTKFKGA